MIWLNGKFIERGAISPADRGFLLGDGLFETILVCKGVPAFLTAHLGRMRAGIRALKMSTEIDEQKLTCAIGTLCRADGLDKGRGAARLTITRGSGARGLRFPDNRDARPVMLLTVSMIPEPGESIATLMVSHFTRSEKSITSRYKTLNYLDNVMASNEAIDAGVDEAVMLNTHGRVSSAAAANIFILNDDGAVLTPSIEEGALPGIVRNMVIESSKAAGVRVIEGQISTAEIVGCPVILTNSVIGLRRAAFHTDSGALVWTIRFQAMVDRLNNFYKELLRKDLSQRVRQ